LRLIQERAFAPVFAALHIVANARHFGHPLFAALYAELRGFAAKDSQAVETTVKLCAFDATNLFF
jgi:hypothetical protein